MPEQYTVTGIVTARDGADRAGFRVEALDRDLPSIERRSGTAPAILAEATTDAEGRFQIAYTLERFREGEAAPWSLRGRGQGADLSFRVFDRTGRELPIKSVEALNRSYEAAHIIFNVPAELEVMIFVGPPREEAGDSEYERLVALLAPILEALAPAELTDEDVEFLVNELGAEQRRELQLQIEWLRRSALLERETGVPVEAFYGWGRKDLPANLAEIARAPMDRLREILERLAALSDDTLRHALLSAVAEAIIPESLRPRADEVVRHLKRRGEVRREVTAQLQDESTGAALAGYSVTTFYRNGAEENRGIDITDNEGRFSFDFYAPRDVPAGAAAREFRLEVSAPSGEKLPQDAHLSVDPARRDSGVITVRVAIPSPERDGRQQQFESVLQGATPELRAFLADRQNIRSFADLRRKGGLRGLADLPEPDPAFARRIESLADLDRVSTLR